MKCYCDSDREMEFVYRWDDAQQTDHCYNIYICFDCGIVLKESLWEDPGKVWINLDNSVRR